MRISFLSMVLCASVIQVWANPTPVHFLPEIGEEKYSSSDWDLACDNRGTCRAAGYYSDDLPVFEENSEFFPVSMMIKREAGKAGAMAKVALQAEDAPLPEEIELFLNEKSFGSVKKDSDKNAWQEEVFVLNGEQLAAILAQSGEKVVIEFRAQKFRWQLSDVGMKEVLQKMDEVQGFAGTRGALLAKGDVPLPTQIYDYPKVADKPFLDKAPRVIKRESEEGKRLLALLRETKNADGYTAGENCEIFDDAAVQEMSEEMRPDFSLWRLNESKSLLTGLCFRGAYNVGDAAWIMDDKLTQVHEYLAMDVSAVADSRINSNFKGRGLGDCFALQEFVWDGEQFVQSLEASTGQCKGFGGGAWIIPTVVVQPENSAPYVID